MFRRLGLKSLGFEEFGVWGFENLGVEVRTDGQRAFRLES